MSAARLLACLALLGPALAAQVLKVPSADYPTIQSAVDAAAAGQTVVVAKGVWDEEVVIAGKTDVLVVGHGRPKIDPSGMGVPFSIVDCARVEVRGFTFVAGPGAGVLLQASADAALVRCRVEGGDPAVAVEGVQRARIERNVLVEAAGTAISFNDQLAGESEALVLRNRILRPASDGIAVRGEDHVLERNRIVEPGDYGGYSANGSSGSRWVRNRIVAPQDGGLLIAGSFDSLEDNRVLASGHLGIHVTDQGDHVALAGNRVVQADGPGLLVEAIECTLADERVRRAGEYGLWVSASLTQVEDVRVSRSGAPGSGYDGVRVAGIFNTFTGCRVTGSDGDGFHVEDIATGCTFTGNRARGSGGLDLNDLAGAGTNTYVDNDFGTSNL